MRKFLLLSAGIVMLCMPSTAQTADEVIAKHIDAKGGMSKLQAVSSELTVGTTELNGNTIRISVLRKRPNKVRHEFSMPGITQVQAYDGDRAWQLSPSQKAAEPLTGEDLRDLKNDTDIDGALVKYKEKGSIVELAGKEKAEGRDAYNLKLVSKEGRTTNYYIDAQTFLEIKSVSTLTHKGEAETIEEVVGDFRPTSGVMYAYYTEFRKLNSSEPPMKIKIEKIELNGPADDSLFEMPHP